MKGGVCHATCFTPYVNTIIFCQNGFFACLTLTGNSLGRDGKYLKDLEDQINEKKERRKREVESQKDWWEKRKDPPFTVKMPNRPHPSQVKIFEFSRLFSKYNNS